MPRAVERPGRLRGFSCANAAGQHRSGSAGSYVIHYAGKVHYDGAKGEETIIQVWGMGPATATPAEKR